MSSYRPTPETKFQTFTDPSDKSTVAGRIAALRQAMREVGIDVYLVPRGDMFRGEYVPPDAERLAWLTAFTGSAGLAVIARDKAALFVDSRYTLQAPAQTDTDIFDVTETAQASMPPAIAEFATENGRIGYDDWVHSPGEIAALRAMLPETTELVACGNLIDKIWTEDRPAPVAHPIEFLGANRAGVAVADKIAAMREEMAASKADAVLLTMPDSVNWTFNIRGRDVPHTPFALGFALVPAEGTPTVFLDRADPGPEAENHQSELAFARMPDIGTALEALGKAKARVWIDPATSPAAMIDTLQSSGAVLIEKRDPAQLPKARKNAAEIAGMREAHVIDGVAMARFLNWFDREAPKGGLTEIDVVTALEGFRRASKSIADISFDTISGAGPNGAIIHYRVTQATNRAVTPGDIMLVDSGGQYLMGTTDITRTMATGPASTEQKDRFTRVLKGMIAISRARFPMATNGAQIDVLARQFLWRDGVTYNHGTGHGVGAFLSVHEGPVGISPRYTTPFEPGNIVSNEPGYYKSGEYGIRIENLVLVVESEAFPGFLEFETLTLAPIDTRLIDVALLDTDERDWLNAYHALVLEKIGPLVEQDVRAWLEQATRPI